MVPRRPILRYHGGKWLLANWIIAHFPAHRRYVEPFGGAGSVLMRKPRAWAEVYNDLDGEVVGVFRVLRDPVAAARLRELLELTPWSRAEFYAAYEPSNDPIEQARRTIVRGFMAFGTTSRRRNRTGFRDKAYRRNRTGPQDWVNYPPAIKTFTERLKSVSLECMPALHVIRRQDDRDTLIYVDPPYLPETRTSLQWDSRNDRAYAVDMTVDDHRELAELLRSAAGMVVISGYASELYDRELYRGWARVERLAHADGGRKRIEVLWLNPACVAALEASKRPLLLAAE